MEPIEITFAVINIIAIIFIPIVAVIVGQKLQERTGVKTSYQFLRY